MGKKNKSKKFKQKLKKTYVTNGDNKYPEEEPCLSSEENDNSSPTKKKSKQFLNKKGEMPKKHKKFRKKNKKKNFKLKYDDECQYLDEFGDFYMEQDLEKLPHDEFAKYTIPITIEENKEYIPLLISESDIILELLDARDVYHSKNNEIEELIKNNDNKILIYVLNKSDLVSEEYIKKIKKNLEEQNNNKNPVIISSCYMREKIHNLFAELKEQIKIIKEKNNSNNNSSNHIIKIGIIGAPNVGKNTLIQSLELIVNSNCDEKYIYFNEEKDFCVNSVPGTIFDEDEKNNFLVSKKYKEVKDIPEPLKLINNLLDIVGKEKLKDIYELNKAPDNLGEFIDIIKDKYMFEDNNITICKILSDIITGKINYEVNN